MEYQWSSYSSAMQFNRRVTYIKDLEADTKLDAERERERERVNKETD